MLKKLFIRQIKWAPVLLLFTSSLSMAAEGYLKSKGYTLFPAITNDSTLSIQGPLPTNTNQILLHVLNLSRNSEGEQVLIPVQGQSLSTHFYLRSGPGKYSVKIYACTPHQNTCNYVTEFNLENRDTRDGSFLFPTQMVQSTSPTLVELARKITENAKTDREKASAIHQWVAENILYDVSAYFSKEYQEMSWDALTVLDRRKSICAGYSYLTAALHRAVEIRAKVVVGVANSDKTFQSNEECNHAWNEVLIDGEWLPMDTTWDAGYVDLSTGKFTPRVTNEYLFPVEDEFSKSHLKCKDLNY